MLLEEFKQWYEKIGEMQKANVEEDRLVSELVNFSMKLGKSEFLEYHFTFLYGENKFDKIIWKRFDNHGEQGICYLINLLKENTIKTEFLADVIELLGKLIKSYKYDIRVDDFDKRRQLVAQGKNAVLSYITSADDIREKVILVLGWIGDESDLVLLGKMLQNDTSSNCRAQAAKAFWEMKQQQIYKYNEEAVTYCYYDALLKAFETEEDLSVLGTMLEVAKEFSGNWFGINREAIEKLDEEKIIEAKQKVIGYLQKR